MAAAGFAKANVSGFFFVSMWVVDDQGAQTPYISGRMNARHVVKVENITSLDYDAKVSASLPHGMRRLEFVQNGNVSSSWKQEIRDIPAFDAVEFECDIRHSSQATPHKIEPIRCDDVADSRGSQPYMPGRYGTPFQMQIEVKVP
ncbi:hypothetical protein [Bradyrhizobium oligotrophicum]|uniref:hypothetical protein n=1 Tax=Bradyrhizobium oligotrophicum TaxID=44255 RepID=UPI003EBB98CD